MDRGLDDVGAGALADADGAPAVTARGTGAQGRCGDAAADTTLDGLTGPLVVRRRLGWPRRDDTGRALYASLWTVYADVAGRVHVALQTNQEASALDAVRAWRADGIPTWGVAP